MQGGSEVESKVQSEPAAFSTELAPVDHETAVVIVRGDLDLAA